MKTTSCQASRAPLSHCNPRLNPGPAFTLVELLVVIGTLAVLSAVLLPAMAAGTRAQSKVTACADNFRQWAVSANLYAADNPYDRLPSFAWGNGGSYLWDVGQLTVSNLAPYGVTVPMWFDPVRPAEFETLQVRYQEVFGSTVHLITITDLSLALAANNYNEAIIGHNVWVPRGFLLTQPEH